ncbi:MAG: hypothetical protein KR126chlam5_01573 [Candidatus Anoxychlamydiales bacterium]|nr:hypothetical protein [Candidatus Anoxychlamydiales bacterium]
MKKKILSILIIVVIIVFVWFKQKPTPKVFDCFPFFNEVELLEVRLNELYDVVDYFVIVESPLTFTGNCKPLYFEANKQRFSKFLDKIIYIVTPAFESMDDPWQREIEQRNYILKGLNKAKRQDIIIISDVDEIVKHSAISKIKKMLLEKQKSKKRKFKYVKIEQNNYRYYLNRVHIEPLGTRAMATTYKQLKKKSPQKLRENIFNDWPIIKEAGWHFSFLGGIDGIYYKIESFSHQEFNNQKYKNKKNIYEKISKCKKVQIDSTYPKYIVDNLKYFKDIGFIDENLKNHKNN